MGNNLTMSTLRKASMFTWNDLLDIAVKMEENGKAVYQRDMDKIKNKKQKIKEIAPVDVPGGRLSSKMLKIFIEFENDTLLFYEFLETFIQDKETLEGLEKIIQEERNHINQLNEMIQAVEAQSIPEEKL